MMLYETIIPDAVLYWYNGMINGVIDCDGHKFYLIRPTDIASFNVFIGVNDHSTLGTTLDKRIENLRGIGKHLNLTIYSTYVLSQTGLRSYSIETSYGRVPKMKLDFEDPINGWSMFNSIYWGKNPIGITNDKDLQARGYISDFNDDVGDGFKVDLLDVKINRGTSKNFTREQLADLHRMLNKYTNREGNSMNYTYKRIPEIKNVIIADPYTTIMWKDGTKTQVKCMEGDRFDPEHGFSMAVLKKIYEEPKKPNAYSKWVKNWVAKGIEAGRKQLKKKNSKRDNKEDGCGDGMCSWSYDEDGNIVKGED